MQYRFGIQLNQFNSALDLNSDDIEYWLNKAQLDIVKNRYKGLTRDKRAFEQSQERVDDLRVLLKRDVELDTLYDDAMSATTGFFVDKADLPVNYMFLIAHKSLVFYNYPSIDFTISELDKRESATYSEKIVFNQVVQSDDIYKLLDDPFNTTKITSPLSIINEDNIQIFTNNKFIVDKVIIDYLKLPVRMSIENNIDSELPEHLHEDIIQRAADMFLNNTRQLKQRLQRETPTSDQELNNEEQ